MVEKVDNSSSATSGRWIRAPHLDAAEARRYGCGVASHLRLSLFIYIRCNPDLGFYESFTSPPHLKTVLYCIWKSAHYPGMRRASSRSSGVLLVVQTSVPSTFPHNGNPLHSVIHYRVSAFSTFVESLVEFIEYSTSFPIRIFMNFHYSPQVFP